MLLARIGKLKVKLLQFGIGLSQIGEFSFVLGAIAYSQKAITQPQFVGILLAVVLSIMGSTLLVRVIPRKG